MGANDFDFYDQDFTALADAETDRLSSDDYEQVFTDICLDSDQWSLMEQAILQTIKTGEGSHVSDCFMTICRAKANKAVRDPMSYYWRSEE